MRAAELTLFAVLLLETAAAPVFSESIVVSAKAYLDVDCGSRMSSW